MGWCFNISRGERLSMTRIVIFLAHLSRHAEVLRAVK
jgi:hypothetical protein